MKKKFSKEEKKQIALEALKSKDKYATADKYDLHWTTIYTWIRLYCEKKGMDIKVTVKLTEEQKELLDRRMKETGYEDNAGAYIRKILFSKNILVGNPKEVGEELYRTRGEINKIGSNINQIANYTNFLKANNYVEKEFIQDLIKETSELMKVCTEQRHSIDKAIRKILR